MVRKAWWSMTYIAALKIQGQADHYGFKDNQARQGYMFRP